MDPPCQPITLLPPHYSASVSVRISVSLDYFQTRSSKYEDIMIQAETAVTICSPWTLCNLDTALCTEGLRSCSAASSIP